MSAPLMPADRWGERLTRRLGLWSAVAVLVGSTIGSGIFRTPAGVARLVDDVPLFLLAWVVGAAVVLCGALTYSELAAAFPRSGAVYIVLVGIVNYFGIHRGAVLQNLSTLLKAGALAVLILAGLLLGGATAATVPDMLAQRAPVGLSPFLLAMVAILWAYDGWADLAFVGGEVQRPQQTLPRALLIGTASVVVLYLGANLVYLHLIPMQGMKQAELVAADVARLLVGPAGVVAISAVIAVSTFGTLNGSMMTAPRIFFAAAEDRVLPQAIARIDPRTSSPTAAVLLMIGMGVIFILVRTFNDLAEQFIIGIWPFYALAVAGVFVLRRTRPQLERPYLTWGYPFVPLVFLVAALFVLGNYLVSETQKFAVDIGIIATGVPVYLAIRRYQRRAPPSAISVR